MLFCGTCLRYGQQQASSSQHSQMSLDFPKPPHWERWAQLAHVWLTPSLAGPFLCHTPLAAEEARTAGHLEVRK